MFHGLTCSEFINHITIALCSDAPSQTMMYLLNRSKEIAAFPKNVKPELHAAVVVNALTSLYFCQCCVCCRTRNSRDSIRRLLQGFPKKAQMRRYISVYRLLIQATRSDLPIDEGCCSSTMHTQKCYKHKIQMQ